MTIYVRSNDTLFIHIHKTAGTSIASWLIDNVGGEKIGKKHETYKSFTSSHFHVTKHFTVVRNPYSRLLSWFHYQGQRSKYRIDNKKQHPHDDKFFEYYEKGFNYWVQEGDPSTRLDKDLFIPQKDWIFRPAFILKYESLNEDFETIKKYFNCYKGLPDINQSSARTLDYRNEYSKRSRKLVTEWFQKDLDYFNYKF